MKSKLLALGTALLLVACSNNSLRDAIPDRRPDYRQSNVSRQLEIPPDLSGGTLDDQLTVPDMNPASVATYRAYSQDNAIRDKRGFIEVLPQLYGVQVVEQPGALPYILVAADTSTTWAAVKKYWENNGIRLRTQEPAIGLMETDWLETSPTCRAPASAACSTASSNSPTTAAPVTATAFASRTKATKPA